MLNYIEEKMNKKAQAGLEYLMTYGWAIVLVAVTMGALVFIVNPSGTEASFSSSDPTKLFVKASAINDGVATIKLQNVTGGQIKVEKISNPSGFYDCKAVNIADDNTVISGGELEIQCNIIPGESSGDVAVEYTDVSGFLQNTLISGSSPGPMAPPPTGEDTDYLCSEGYDNDGDNLVDCLDPDCIGFTGTGQYPNGAKCQQPESTCDDSFDNDADGDPDCDDSDCAAACQTCGNGILEGDEWCDSLLTGECPDAPGYYTDGHVGNFYCGQADKLGCNDTCTWCQYEIFCDESTKS